MLQHWRANVDLQIVVDVDACARYMAKYIAKAEPRSEPAVGILKTCTERLNDTDQASSVLKKAMIKVAGDRDMGAQETAHMLLQEPLYHCTYSFVTVPLDESRRVNHRQGKEGREPGDVLQPSLLSLYAKREQWEKEFPGISDLNFMEFATKFYVTKHEPQPRSKEVIARAYPSFSSNPAGKNYALYCKYQLIKHKPWRGSPENAWDGKEECSADYVRAYNEFLSTEYAQQHLPKVASEIERAQHYLQTAEPDDDDAPVQPPEEACEEWMLLCRLNQHYDSNPSDQPDSHDWSSGATELPPELLRACPQWVAQQKKERSDVMQCGQTTNIDITKLNKNQRLAFDIVQQHQQARYAEEATVDPLRMIISGTAGTGKSYLISAIAELLKGECVLTGTTGMAGFNIHGCTLHSVLKLPVRDQRNKELEGQSLQRLQMSLEGKHYLLIDEMSMLGQKNMAWVDRRLRQATGKLAEPFGGMSVILIGDFGQLPPVGDRPIYAARPGSVLGDQGHTVYKLFDTVILLTEMMRQAGDDPEATAFRALLLRLRDGQSTEDDWRKLLTRAPTTSNQAEFKDAVRLFFDKASVASYNYEKLKSLNTPIARISAKHSGTGAAAAKSDDAGGLDPEIFLARGAQVMLTSNLWQEMGLCNGSPGTVQDILFAPNSGPPDLPIAVLVHFPHYVGPPFMEDRPKCVPVPPQLFEWQSHGSRLSRLQVPLRLRYAMTIHKSQGQTLEKVVIDLGKSERAAGCTFVAASRVRSLDHALFQPMSFQRLQSIGKGKGLKNRKAEDLRLAVLAQQTCCKSWPGAPMAQPTISRAQHGEPRTSKVRIHFSRLQNQDLHSIREFVHSEGELLHHRVNEVRHIEPAIYSGMQIPEHHVMAQLHPAVQTQYTAIPTSPDGNCLWHMVSQGLTGTEELTADLRLLTVLTLVQNEQYFTDLLGHENHDQSFADIVNTAATWGAWGGKFHLHALSLALNRAIHVYSSFRQRDGSFPYKDCNSAQLSQLFIAKANWTRQHFIYQKPGVESFFGRAAIKGFFTATPWHFTTLLPNSVLGVSFVPSTNLFSHGDSGLLSHHFR